MSKSDSENNNPDSEERNPPWLKITLALISLLSAVLVVLVPLVVNNLEPSTPAPQSFEYPVRVQIKDSEQGIPGEIPNAKIILEVAGKAPLDEIADSNGFARFTIDTSYANKPGRLIVQATGYKTYAQNIDLVKDALPDIIQLEPMPVESAHVETTAISTLIASPLPTFTEEPTSASTPTPVATPSQTPVPTPTFALSLTPTSTPTPKPRLLVEGFENYNTSSLLATIQINKNAGNEGFIKLVGLPHVNEGVQALAFDYDIRNPSPNHYIGFEREFPAQDWSNFALLCLWAKVDGSNRDLVVQFGESKGDFWKQTDPFAIIGTGDHCIPLNQSGLNLSAISYYGIYVEGPVGQGTIFIDNVRVTTY